VFRTRRNRSTVYCANVASQITKMVLQAYGLKTARNVAHSGHFAPTEGAFIDTQFLYQLLFLTWETKRLHDIVRMMKDGGWSNYTFGSGQHAFNMITGFSVLRCKLPA